MPSPTKKTINCFCGLDASLDQCCGRYHAGVPAPTAEALMRSRYSAYVLERADYLRATWHPSTRPGAIDFADSPRWLGLTIQPALQKKSDNATSESADSATVEFVARYRIGGRAHRLHELSRFVREDGRWFYVDGDIR